MISLEWQQLLTHAVGFLITLWILKKFAWGPLLGLMEERRNRIVDEFKRIDDEKAKVAQQAAAYEVAQIFLADGFAIDLSPFLLWVEHEVGIGNIRPHGIGRDFRRADAGKDVADFREIAPQNLLRVFL